MALGEWEFKPEEILASKRKVKGIFHKSVVDKDNEFITPDAIKKSIPDFMHLPALHDFHKERPVGLATRIWENKDGSFGFEGVIKATEDADDIWEKISKGNYDHVSIFGRRTEGNQNCSLPQGLRTGPCITNGVRLDSISVCDDNARNDETSLSVKKAQLIWDGMEMIRKAETAGTSNLMHTPTDYSEEKKSHPLHVVSGSTKGTNEASRHMYEGQDAVSSGGKRGELNPKYKPGHKVKKGDEEDDEMTDDVEKSKDVHYKGGIKEGLQVTHRAVRPRTAQKRGDTEYEIRQNKRDDKRDVKKGEDEEVEKGDVSEDDADDEEQYDEESDSSKKKVSPKDKEGQWSKDKDPQGSVKVKKAEKEQEIDTETRGEDAKEDMDEDDEDEDVEKSHEGKPWSQKPGQASVGNMVHQMRDTDKKIKQKTKGLPEKEAAAGLKNLHKGTVKKGDTMEEQEEVSQEYVTKAMVPIEEVDTIIKARTEEISKAYTAQFDEIKKANLAAIDEVKKAYDAKIAELTTRVDKMSEETIRKGGSIVVIPQLLDPENKGFGSNADALAKISAGK
jgi:hypothetical protein